MDPRRAVLPRPGDRFAGRDVEAVCGRGGTSTVFRVRRGAEVEALKVLDPVLADPARARARFRREFEIARELVHPHVIAAHDHGELPGPVLWSTMEFVGGGTGAGLVPVGGAEPDLPRVLAVLGQVADGLDHAHRMDVVHRDVKPTNVLLTATDPGRAVVADFGIARFLDDTRPLARNGRVSSSLPYAAPEVLVAGRLTPATDVYSLACTAVEWLTGSPPYPFTSPFAVVNAHLTGRAPSLRRRRPWLPPAVDEVVARALAPTPADRPASCGDLAEQLAAVLAGVAAPVPGRRRRWWG